MTAMQSFFQGVASIFSFGRVRLFDDIEAELDRIHPFASDADAIRHDFENVGRDIQKAILKYEQQRTQPKQHKTV